MPVKIHWKDDNENNNTLIWDFIGNWTWDEFHRTMKEVDEILAGCPYPVNVIIDASHNLSIPIGNNVLNILQEMVTEKGNELGVMVVVATPNYIRALSHGMDRVFRRWSRVLKFTSSIPTAEKIIQESQQLHAF